MSFRNKQEAIEKRAKAIKHLSEATKQLHLAIKIFGETDPEGLYIPYQGTNYVEVLTFFNGIENYIKQLRSDFGLL